MDPLTLMATVTAAYNGVKKAVAIGREAHDIMRQLGQWAEAADKMYSYVVNEQAKTPGLFESTKFDKSETREALDLAAVKLQLKQMEDDIKTMFFYGELQELGQAGYSEFIQNRKKIREDRVKILKKQAQRRAEALDTLFWSFIAAVTLAFALFVFYQLYAYGVSRGVW